MHGLDQKAAKYVPLAHATFSKTILLFSILIILIHRQREN
jgi:hypothetical protein